MDIKFTVEFTIRNADNCDLEEFSLEEYVEEIIEEEGLDCFIEEGEYELIAVETT